ncbi:hypothetical protein BDV95DRAFT_281642 [Massariosphaeria phaeospora]|uniref:Kelch repeat protein-like protein n=1 Tax=Massariosphaeria phaeospora TaxID=100035 RepID=A0A7C8ILK3_9PLEO|nr:hypothetical protein BDV95DRAFT_281642 [Massariosphaeria phaeospora]
MLPWSACFAFGLSSVFFVAAQRDYLQPETFIRRRYHSSAKLRDYIYIDGGELSWLNSSGGVESAQNPKTQSIDLSKSWVNTSLRLRELDRGNAPALNFCALWVDEAETTMYPFGGELSFLTDTGPRPPQPWEFVADGKGGGLWAQGTVAPASNFSSLVQPAGGSYTYGNGVGYYLGGHLFSKSWPARDWYPVTGLVTHNMTSNTWTNVTSVEYDQGRVSHFGIAHFVSHLGPSGLVLFIGGRTSPDDEMNRNEEKRSFADIAMYEPGSGKWFHQIATGTIPEWRTRPCAVGVKGENDTYEIFIYGGANTALYGGQFPTEMEAEAANALDEIFVLSLPAFVWFKANYTAKSSRQSHTCHLVGKRQLLTIGGIDPSLQEYYSFQKNATDPFTLGLGVFDLTEMTWSDGYNADAPEYRSPRDVFDYYLRNTRYPVWGSPDLASLFGDDNALIASSPLPTETSTTVNHHSDHSPQSDVPSPEKSRRRKTVYIVVPLVVFLILVAIGVFCIRLAIRRKRDNASKKPDAGTSELDSNQLGELASVQRHELAEQQCFEMAGGPMSPIRRYSTTDSIYEKDVVRSSGLYSTS